MLLNRSGNKRYRKRPSFYDEGATLTIKEVNTNYITKVEHISDGIDHRIDDAIGQDRNQALFTAILLKEMADVTADKRGRCFHFGRAPRSVSQRQIEADGSGPVGEHIVGWVT